MAVNGGTEGSAPEATAEEARSENTAPEDVGPEEAEGPKEKAGCGQAEENDETEADEEAGRAREAPHTDRNEFIAIDAKHVAQISPSCRNSGG